MVVEGSRDLGFSLSLCLTRVGVGCPPRLWEVRSTVICRDFLDEGKKKVFSSLEGGAKFCRPWLSIHMGRDQDLCLRG